jgi:cyclopropane-fatty-acyl-phospholipid synthase
MEKLFRSLLDQAQIQLNGANPWDIQIDDPKVIQHIFSHGSLGLGETYMQRKWHVDHLDEFFSRILGAQLDQKIKPSKLIVHAIKYKLFNKQSIRRSFQVGEHHYNIGNDFYEAMLDKRMAYTCGYWQNAKDLDQAQEHKLELICQKLRLKPGMRLLDIGCGWGSLMGYAAEKYGVECVGVTVSSEQAQYGNRRYANLPIEFRLQDYRQINEQFDAIASVGMFEHVGRKNYKTYMNLANRCLKEDGLFLLHTIGKNISNTSPDPWIDRYIFPNGDLPSIKQIASSIEKLFIVEDWHNFGADYDKTLLAWHDNFEKAWPKFKNQYGDVFYRMWRYYLLSCAGSFRTRYIQLWQIVMSKRGVLGGYQRPLM